MAIFIMSYELNPKQPDYENKKVKVRTVISAFQHKRLAPTTYLLSVPHRDDAECAIQEIIDGNDKLFIAEIVLPPFATQRDVKVWLRARQFFPV